MVWWQSRVIHTVLMLLQLLGLEERGRECRRVRSLNNLFKLLQAGL
jgi:hypothetical protein